MSSMSMGGGARQVVRPPQRGIFPLDHQSECQIPMEDYLVCLQRHAQQHHECREQSRLYLQCRMDRGLMARENLDQMGYSPEAAVRGAREYDGAKERSGFVAGKHIAKVESKGASPGGK
jgi:cytochrome c oxidase assembly protein subunit 19